MQNGISNQFLYTPDQNTQIETPEQKRRKQYSKNYYEMQKQAWNDQKPETKKIIEELAGIKGLKSNQRANFLVKMNFSILSQETKSEYQKKHLGYVLRNGNKKVDESIKIRAWDDQGYKTKEIIIKLAKSQGLEESSKECSNFLIQASWCSLSRDKKRVYLNENNNNHGGPDKPLDLSIGEKRKLDSSTTRQNEKSPSSYMPGMIYP